MSITDADIDRAAKAVKARLERVLEYQIPESDPSYMEVRRLNQKRESELRGVRRGSPSPVTSERLGL